MKKILFSLCFFCSMIFFLNSCGKSDAVDNSGTISGFVTDITNANAPIAGATVTLSSKGLSQTTGSDGRYQFSDVDPGSYTLQAIANHYQPTTKQVTVGVNQNVTCDFQLSAGAVSVDISPVTLNFGTSAEQLSFTITNNSTGALNYNISNIPNFVQVSPSTGSVAARGKQAVTVSVINRASITAPRNGQMTVNIGSDSYTISISVEPYQPETVSVDINPTTLSFDKNTEQLKFTMSSNYSRDLDFTIGSNLDILTVTPTSGTLTARGQTEVSVTVNDRKNVTTDRNGTITIGMGGNNYVVNVSVAKYEEDVTPASEINTNRGLLAYYGFDNNTADDVTDNKYHGTLSGGAYTTDTPNGKGKALQLKAKEFMAIGNNPVDGKKAQTINMWIKDFGPGTLLKLSDGTNLYAPTMLLSDDVKLTCYHQTFGSDRMFEASTSLSSYQSDQWVMITLVLVDAVTNKSGVTSGTMSFYVNGRKIDSAEKTIQTYGTSMTIGGQLKINTTEIWNSAMKIDNVRLHGVALSSDEIAAIYEAEKK